MLPSACAVVPALDAATLGAVLDNLRATLGIPVLVVDDGSSDATRDVARAHGVDVLRHERNRGKGAALRTGLLEAARRGPDAVVTVDADGQRPGRLGARGARGERRPARPRPRRP